MHAHKLGEYLQKNAEKAKSIPSGIHPSTYNRKRGNEIRANYRCFLEILGKSFWDAEIDVLMIASHWKDTSFYRHQ